MKASQREGQIQNNSLMDSKYNRWLLVLGIIFTLQRCGLHLLLWVH